MLPEFQLLSFQYIHLSAWRSLSIDYKLRLEKPKSPMLPLPLILIPFHILEYPHANKSRLKHPSCLKLSDDSTKALFRIQPSIYTNLLAGCQLTEALIKVKKVFESLSQRMAVLPLVEGQPGPKLDLWTSTKTQESFNLNVYFITSTYRLSCSLYRPNRRPGYYPLSGWTYLTPKETSRTEWTTCEKGRYRLILPFQT